MTTSMTPQAAPTTQAPVQPTGEESPEAQKTEEQLSPKFAALARQQKLIRRQQMEFKAREDALKAKEQEYTQNYIPKDRLKSDYLSLLSEQGITPEDIVTAISSQDPQSMALKKLEQMFKGLEDKLQKKEQSDAEKHQKDYERAVEQVRNEVKMLVDSDATYETIKAQDASEAVVELIKQTFENEGKLLTAEAASKQVEEYLLEEAIKLASLEKVKNRLTPKVEEAPVKQAAPVPQKNLTKTLTNANTMVPSKPLTANDRRERAIAAFRGNRS